MFSHTRNRPRVAAGPRQLVAAATVLLLSASAVTPAVADAPATTKACRMLGNASDGSSVTVTRDECVVVDLKGSVGKGTEFVWSKPVVSDRAVLSLQGYSQLRAETRASYKAARVGSATITSQEACRVTAPGYVCPLFLRRPWHVRVTVMP